MTLKIDRMSFVDLATLALHRRNEMEARIKVFVNKCDTAVTDILRLKQQAQNFVHQLNCEPSELKERFLNSMKQLDEYIYLITDFNLSVGKLAEETSIDFTPVHDTSAILLPTPALPTFNIMDVLSEPMPSTSRACPNFCPVEKPVRKKIPKEEQTLIVFSSASCSSESVPANSETVDKNEKEVQCELTQAIQEVTLSETYNLPGQAMLQTEQVYPALIMNVDGISLWIITDNIDEATKLMLEMTAYYKAKHVAMSLEDVKSLVYCAYYDNESDCYYRGLFLRLTEEGVNEAEVFLVDTGETRTAACAREALQPLAARFCTVPPFARCCHLAGVDFMNDSDKGLMEKQEEFLRQYVGIHCSIEVDENTSESLGVYVTLSGNKTLNDILVQQGLAVSTENPAQAESRPVPAQGPPELVESGNMLDIADCPEYDDPLEAVTGYSCRDEADICKHYKGGPEKTCFKGTRCKKKHILKHPDGWTLDQVEIIGKCPLVPLPAPGTWHKMHVTYICHFDRVSVQLVQEKGKETEELPSFGVVLPPTNLSALFRDMNSPAARMAYKPLKMTPATGEYVAALYPPDNQWYRARVLTVSRSDQNLEVQFKIRYIDYGNVMWVKEDAIRVLDPRYMVLPEQAVQCTIAGITTKSHDSRHWAEIKQHLEKMTLERTLDAHVIARDYDELTIELFDEQGYSVAEQLAALNLVVLTEYEIIDDTKVTKKLVVPREWNGRISKQ